MLYEKNNICYIVCDECKKEKIVKRQYYLLCKRKNININLCGSCRQKGKRNHSHGKNPWNIGLTKETDERVKQYGLNGSKSKLGCVPWNKNKSYEELKGKEWSNNFKNKVSKVKTGVPNLKIRGITTNYAKCFRNIRKIISMRLYNTWGRKIMERDKFCCQKCPKVGGKLEVHHLKPLRNIIKEVAKNINLDLNKWNEWDSKTIENFVVNVIDFHKMEHGITLCRKCHCEVDLFRHLCEKRLITDSSLNIK